MEYNNNLGVSVKEAIGRADTESTAPAVTAVVKSKKSAGKGKSFDEAVAAVKKTIYGPANHKAAVISHYVHSGFRQYGKEAIQYMKEMLAEHLPGQQISDEAAKKAAIAVFSVNQEFFFDPRKPKFSFIDLFAGIGGFRIAMQNNGGKCIFTSEWDKMAQMTYHHNYGEVPFGDITLKETKDFIPEKFDVLCGGFPCQPFSIAGVVKKNSLGRAHGFDDEKQGNLFFHIADIIERHRPKAFFLENVKNLISHDKGNTFRVIRETLEELNYSFYHQVIDGKNYVPQHRQRTFMVGFDREVFKGKENFSFPEKPKGRGYNLPQIIEASADPKYTLSDKLWNYLQDYAQKHKAAGNGFGFGLINPWSNDAYTRTISARYYKDGAEVLVPQGDGNPRRLTPRECARLQGYPETFRIPVSDNQAYRQFGNSVVVPLIEAIGRQIVKVIV